MVQRRTKKESESPLTLDWCPVHKPTKVLSAERRISSCFDFRSCWMSFTPSLRKICSAPASSRDNTTRFWAAWNSSITKIAHYCDATTLPKRLFKGNATTLLLIVTFCRSESLADESARRENICCTRASVEFICSDWEEETRISLGKTLLQTKHNPQSPITKSPSVGFVLPADGADPGRPCFLAPAAHTAGRRGKPGQACQASGRPGLSWTWLSHHLDHYLGLESGKQVMKHVCVHQISIIRKVSKQVVKPACVHQCIYYLK